MSGPVVYPIPGSTRSILRTTLAFELLISAAPVHTTIPPLSTAVAIPVVPPVGADDMATLGAKV